MPRVKLTARRVACAKCPVGKKRELYFDTETRGLMLEVRESGGKTYYARFRDRDNIQRDMKISDATSIDLLTARRRVIEINSTVVSGKEVVRRPVEQRTMTLGSFATDRYLPFVKGYKRSWKCDESLIRTHILPKLGDQDFSEIVEQDVINLTHALREAGKAAGTVNRVLIILRYMYNLAMRWDVEGIGRNPTARVPLFKENNKEQTFLDKEQIEALLTAAKRSENGLLHDIICFLLLTGARRSEALHAEWKDFDFRHRVWIIPETKSGLSRSIPLSNGTMALLMALPSRERSAYLFPNPKTGRPFHAIYYSWDTARKEAGLAGVRMHDLRHSFASMLVNGGESLYVVQKLLGHAHIKTTQRYAHLSNGTLLAATNRTAEYFPELK